MLNVIRTCPGRVKYCGATVDNLIESNGGDRHDIHIVSSSLAPNANGLEALRVGIKYGDGKPFVFLEDDLSFIKEFNRSAHDFWFNCQGNNSPVLPLCAAYPDALKQCRGLAWRYNERAFYGSQAIVFEPEAAQQVIDHAGSENPVAERGFDMLIRRWAQKKGIRRFLTPYLSFVQHLGVESSLHNGRFHHYSTWPGRDWTYRSGAFNLLEQKSRPCDMPVAKGISEWFGKTLPAYDLGCSTGKYLTVLKGAGIQVQGFDATPGLGGSHPAIEELDLARPQVFHEKPGNVMCLEVAEHIHPENEAAFIGNLHSLCADKLVLSWADKGQGGRRHVNEKSGEDVIHLLRSIGMACDRNMSNSLRAKAELKWFKNNLFAFQRA